MKGKKAAASRLLAATGVLGLLERSRLGRGVPILAYHRVVDVPDEDAWPFDIELVSASVAQFERQVAWLAARYRPVALGTLVDELAQGRKPPRGTVVITFDDGFEDNYTHAFPILARHGVPATVFLATGFLDEGSRFWYEDLAHALLEAPGRNLRLPGRAEASVPGDMPGRRAMLAALLAFLKMVPDAERRRLVDAAMGQLRPGGSAPRDPRSAPLTWEQVREMAGGGIEFGSHTVTHPILSRLDEGALRWELEHSRARIEAATGRACTLLAYPVGGQEAFDRAVRGAAHRAGYRLGVSYIPGADDPRDWDPFAVRRLHVERYVGFDAFRAMLALPGVFA